MATKLKNLRISKVDFVDEGANPDAHIKLTKSKGEKGQSTGENGDKNGFVSRLFGFIGKKAGMNQEEIDSAVHLEVLESFLRHAKENNFTILGITYSPIRGPEGNIEYLGYLRKSEEQDADIDLRAVVTASHETLKEGEAQ